ncbi:MAG: disulfide bond formation protein B [Candidatus Peribacteraceae bacterium]|nr:disulfide bond formation protein B [Candidatus Peribacteraceae bacterium]
MQYTWLVVSILSWLTFFADFLIAFLLSLLLWKLSTKRSNKIIRWIDRHALLLMLIIAVIATVGSLFLSDIAGWTPCKDCWYQRIFMYPQVVLLAIALWRRDRGIVVSILVLSLIGILFSIEHYHEQLQLIWNPEAVAAPCDESGVSCAKTPTLRLGYITIPMMAMSAFALNILGSLVILMHRKKNS